jgi:ureidoglycolate hydrolase
MKPIELITRESFEPFGNVIAFPKEDRTNFYIAASDSEKPWRLAVFRYWNHEIQRIESHPTSMESFEPLSGTSLLLAAPHEAPQDYHVFLLDQPVILKKGIWHQTLTLTDVSEVKITENIDVYSDFYDLPKKIRVGIM